MSDKVAALHSALAESEFSDEGYVDYNELEYGLFYFYDDDGAKSITLPGFGRLEGVERFGGEGQGDQYWYVFKLTAEDGTETFFKVDGYYQSYSGGEYDSIYEVQPVQRMATYYESV